MMAGPAAADGGAAPPLRVAIPPGPGVVRGFDRDLFTAVAREVGADFAPEDAPPAEALRRLDAGEIDVAAGPYRPGEAGSRPLLPPVALSGDLLLKRRGDGALLKPGDAAGKRVAPLPGTADVAALRAAARGLGAVVAGRAGDLADRYADLASGRVAALVGPSAAVAAAALARPGAVEVVGPAFGPTLPLAAAMRSGDPRARAVAEALGRLRADGRLAALERRWFGSAADGGRVP